MAGQSSQAETHAQLVSACSLDGVVLIGLEESGGRVIFCEAASWGCTVQGPMYRFEAWLAGRVPRDCTLCMWLRG